MQTVPGQKISTQQDAGDTPKPLSMGARVLDRLLWACRAEKGGARHVAQRHLAKLMDRHCDSVRRYAAELEAHGLWSRQAPDRQYRTEGVRRPGWRSVSCNRYVPLTAYRKAAVKPAGRKAPGQTGPAGVRGRPLTGTGGGHSQPAQVRYPLHECADPWCRAPYRGPDPGLCPGCRG